MTRSILRLRKIVGCLWLTVWRRELLSGTKQEETVAPGDRVGSAPLYRCKDRFRDKGPCQPSVIIRGLASPDQSNRVPSWAPVLLSSTTGNVVSVREVGAAPSLISSMESPRKQSKRIRIVIFFFCLTSDILWLSVYDLPDPLECELPEGRDSVSSPPDPSRISSALHTVGG